MNDQGVRMHVGAGTGTVKWVHMGGGGGGRETWVIVLEAGLLRMPHLELFLLHLCVCIHVRVRGQWRELVCEESVRERKRARKGTRERELEGEIGRQCVCRLERKRGKEEE